MHEKSQMEQERIQTMRVDDVNVREKNAGVRLEGEPSSQLGATKPRAGARSGTIARKLWAGAGFAAFGLGFLGAILPLLPTTPFILLAGFCFARSSEKVNRWFKATKLYKLVFENYTKKRTMTLKAKLTLLLPLTALLGISFALLSGVPAMRAVIATVWCAHIVYFGFVVKTEPVAISSAPELIDVADHRMPAAD